MHFCKALMKRRTYAALFVALAGPVSAVAQQITLRPDGGAEYRWDASGNITGQGHLVTSTPGTFTGADVAGLIGATTFYSQGYTGTRAIASNIEAGHVWDGHESLSHATSRTNDASAPSSTFVTPAYDRHATRVAMMIGGRSTAPGNLYQQGIAYGATLRSGATATSWTGSAYSLSFNATSTSIANPYASNVSGFGTAHVINSSWGATSTSGSAEAGGTDIRTMIIDSLANQRRFTTSVVSAGNSGATSDPMVGAPGSGYNSITVGALQNNGANVYSSVASFSSRGPQDYRQPGLTVLAATARRAAVDIVAPGTSLTSAHYGGQSGGNDPSLSGSSNSPGNNLYAGGLAGTSYSSPIVAGGVALMHDAALALNLPQDARDGRVIKANLLNAAAKIPGWNNGQTAHSNGNGGVVTTQALDFVSGAGALDLTRTYDQFLSGVTDITGTTGGSTSETIGWDYGIVSRNGAAKNDYVINTPLSGEFRVTLSWFRERTYSSSSLQTDVGMANLDLQVWDSTFTNLVSESLSIYNTVEHLTFNLPTDGLYGIRVKYTENLFGSMNSEEYGLAWWGTAVPEPGTAAALLALLSAGLMRRRGA